MDAAVLQTATVAEAMQPFDSVPATMSLGEAAALMRTHHGRALIVDTGDDSPAIFTEYDIVKVVGAGESLDGKVVGDHHTNIAVAATPDWSLVRAVDTMLQGQFRHLVVVDAGETVGLLAMRDILAVMLGSSDRPERSQETIEFSAEIDEDAGHLLHNLRRSAKQHLVAAKCACELEWMDVLIGQAEERPDLTRDELQQIWEQRHPCPALHSMGGGGD
ncbi:MAG: CBS domain-containing protein [Solirubrobacterales bacterium]